ncbi:MAG: HAMP domain-containing sensor histidine kinase [Acidimicrobiales bacterium]
MNLRLGIRARVTLAFALGALLLSLLLSVATYALTRANLLRQREVVAESQVLNNAERVQEGLPRQLVQIVPLLQSLQRAQGSEPLLIFGGRPFSLDGRIDEKSIPPELLDAVATDRVAARMRYRPDAGVSQLATGVPIPSAGAAYFEIVDMSDLEGTLRQLGLSLIAAGVITTLAGAALGSWAARRTLSPLADVSAAATAIAGGRLDTRLDPVDDPDLDGLVRSFNQMVAALQERIERDARFATDVSHELRSPLQTLAAAVQVLERRRSELSDRSQAAVGLLSAEVDRFQELVGDLLEISRFDAGAQRLELDEVRLDQVVMEAVRASGSPDVPVEVDAALAGAVVPADKRRLMRVIANLLENAEKYAGGATAVTLTRGDDGRVVIAVADDGPGIPETQRAVIFDRFARGAAAGRRGTGDGVGLGLALVEEHVRLHGGRVWVEERDLQQGARFVVELPVLAGDKKAR